MNKDIEDLRQKIDSIEDNIIALLNERSKYALEIGKIKKQNGLSIKVADREKIILDRIAKKNTNIVSSEFLVNVFKKIIEETVKLEHNAS